MRLGRVPGLRQLPPRLRRVDERVALFESWHGGYADNPRAISEALERRGADLERLWATDEEARAPHGRRYLEALGRARWIVTTLSMPGYFRKKPGTTYLQTWHGTPLKKIGFDIERPRFADGERFTAALAADVAQWDCLISQNPFSTEVFRRAFHYEGEILETGYPRNDVLSSPEAPHLGRELRARLGIEPEARVVL